MKVYGGGKCSEIKVGTMYVAQESVKSTRIGSESKRIKSGVVDATEGALVATKGRRV
jgi:hypothetical protein